MYICIVVFYSHCIRNMEVLNDRGPLFKYTQDYNLNAVVPFTFHWVNQIPHTFVDIRDIDRSVGRHYDRISLSLPVSYTQVLQAIVKFTPRMLYIHKKIVNDGVLPEQGPDPIKLENLITLIYVDDLKLDFVEKFLPNLQYIYTESLSCVSSLAPGGECAHNTVFERLKVFSCTRGTSFALEIRAPNLVELNIYKLVHGPRGMGDDDDEPRIDLGNYRHLRVLRLPDNVRVRTPADQQNTVLLNTLQFFFNRPGAVNDSSSVPGEPINNVRGSFDGDYYMDLVARYKPRFLILPPNVLAESQVDKLPAAGVQALGVSIHENLAVRCFSLFPLLEIYDSYNMHAAMSVRQTTDLSKYVSRIYKSLHTNVNDLISGIDIRQEPETKSPDNKPYLLMLCNFDPSDSLYMNRWLYTIEQFRQKLDTNPILVMRCEIVKTRTAAGTGGSAAVTANYDKSQFAWPSVVQCLRKRIIIMNTQTKLLHIDISLNSIQNIISLMQRIYKMFAFEKVVIITHGFTISDFNVDLIKKAIPPDTELNIHSVPYMVYS